MYVFHLNLKTKRCSDYYGPVSEGKICLENSSHEFLLSKNKVHFKDDVTLNLNVCNKAHHITYRGYQGTDHVQLN